MNQTNTQTQMNAAVSRQGRHDCSQPNKQQNHWYREPWMWLVVGLPATVVVAGLSMLWFASLHPETMVEAPHMKVGFTVKAVKETSPSSRKALEPLGVK